MTLKILAADFDAPITVDGRIAGVVDIKELQLTGVAFGKFLFWIGSTIAGVSWIVWIILVLFGVKLTDLTWLYGLWTNAGVFIVAGVLAMTFPNAFNRFMEDSRSGPHF